MSPYTLTLRSILLGLLSLGNIPHTWELGAPAVSITGVDAL